MHSTSVRPVRKEGMNMKHCFWWMSFPVSTLPPLNQVCVVDFLMRKNNTTCHNNNNVLSYIILSIYVKIIFALLRGWGGMYFKICPVDHSLVKRIYTLYLIYYILLLLLQYILPIFKNGQAEFIRIINFS